MNNNDWLCIYSFRLIYALARDNNSEKQHGDRTLFTIGVGTGEGGGGLAPNFPVKLFISISKARFLVLLFFGFFLPVKNFLFSIYFWRAEYHIKLLQNHSRFY